MVFTPDTMLGSVAKIDMYVQAVASTSGRLPLASVRLLEVHTASFSPVTRTLRTQAQSNEGKATGQLFSQTSEARSPVKYNPVWNCRYPRVPASAKQKHVYSDQCHTKSCKHDVPARREGYAGDVSCIPPK